MSESVWKRLCPRAPCWSQEARGAFEAWDRAFSALTESAKREAVAAVAAPTDEEFVWRLSQLGGRFDPRRFRSTRTPLIEAMVTARVLDGRLPKNTVGVPVVYPEIDWEVVALETGHTCTDEMFRTER